MTTTRKWLLRITLAAFGLGLLAGIGVYVDWKRTRSLGEARRDEAVRALDSVDPGWRIDAICAERNGRLPPDDQNAAVQIVAAEKLIPSAYKDWLHCQDYVAPSDIRPPFLPKPRVLREMKAAHAASAEVLQKLRSTRSLPSGGVPLVMSEPNLLLTPLPHIQPIRDCAAMVEFDTMVLAADGKANEAVESVRLILCCARSIGDEPSVVAQVIRMVASDYAFRSTERVLGWSEPSTDLSALQTELTREMAVSRFVIGIRGERGCYVRLLENVDRGAVSIAQLQDATQSHPPDWKDRVRQEWCRKHAPAHQAMALDLFRALLDAEKLTGRDRQSALQRTNGFPPPEGIIPTRKPGNLLTVLFTAGYQQFFASEDRIRAQLCCAVTGVACERYRRQHGKWPASLDAIPKDILPEVPADQYVGGPIRYRLTNFGAVVYTTGPDLTDDGGEVLDTTGADGTDIGFRLFNTDQRGRPAPPKHDPMPVGPDPDDR